MSIKKFFNENFYFLLFVVLTFVINGIYFIIYLKTKFILSSLYFLFNFMAIIVFSFVFCEEKITKNVSNIFKFNIVVQLIIYFLGIGKWYGFTRYMGTFNDPNQFGYYILMCFSFVYLTSLRFKDYKGWFLYLILSLFLIFLCASTGMFLAFLIMVFLLSFDLIKNISRFIYRNKVKIFLFLLFIIPLLLISFLIFEDSNKFKLDNVLILNRIIEKINKADSNGSSVSLVQERGYDRFIYYPQYILFGSGEGEYTRFEKTYHQDEIHATFPSILFYYGIIPTLILFKWIFSKIKKSKFKVLIPILAIFIESFTLLNQRQSMFWIIILYVFYINNDFYKEKKNEDSFCS